jgi:hypothetical protein
LTSPTIIGHHYHTARDRKKPVPCSWQNGGPITLAGDTRRTSRFRNLHRRKALAAWLAEGTYSKRAVFQAVTDIVLPNGEGHDDPLSMAQLSMM